MLQEIINKVVNWFNRDSIAKFNKEHEELTRGRQFPDEETISKQLDYAIQNSDGNKISTDFLSHHNDNTPLVGIDNTMD